MTTEDNEKSGSSALQSGTLVAPTRRSAHIVTRMVGGALDIARQMKVATPQLFRIGDYELRGPDYRQVLWWANELCQSPEELLSVLATKGRRYKIPERIHFEIKDGRIKTLIWDGRLLAIQHFGWEAGLEIETLVVHGRMPVWRRDATLGSLRELHVMLCDLTHIDLTPIPRLEVLHCGRNEFTSLNLSPVPNLTVLSCHRNQLTEIDLSPVPLLIDLRCYNNQLTALDLSPVRQLVNLDCSYNSLTTLDLSPVGRLQHLVCAGNHFTDLDLRPLDNPDINVGCYPELRIVRR